MILQILSIDTLNDEIDEMVISAEDCPYTESKGYALKKFPTSSEFEPKVLFYRALIHTRQENQNLVEII